MSCTVQNVAGTLMAAATTDEFKTQAASQPVSHKRNKPFPLGNADMFNHVQESCSVWWPLFAAEELSVEKIFCIGRSQAKLCNSNFTLYTLKHDPPIDIVCAGLICLTW